MKIRWVVKVLQSGFAESWWITSTPQSDGMLRRTTHTDHVQLYPSRDAAEAAGVTWRRQWGQHNGRPVVKARRVP